MGEPAGIGPDITLKTWLDRETWLNRGVAPLPAFCWIGDPVVLTERAQKLGLTIPLHPLDDVTEAASVFDTALPVLPVLPVPCDAPITAGAPSAATAHTVIRALDLAVDLALQGKASGIVTNPIQKAVLYQAGFTAAGHTDYLEDRTRQAGFPAQAVMMLAVPGLKVVPVTVHIPLGDVAKALTRETIIETGLAVAAALRDDFGLSAPRLAIAGLNPHAGEAGALGDEENMVIRPAVDDLRAQGLDVNGPYPADTLFHDDARTTYDAALCMYHDQALIPLKTLNFYEGVNVTLGLPFVRTSPDHGTALDIAGTGQADHRSLMAALRMADEIATRRATAD